LLVVFGGALVVLGGVLVVCDGVLVPLLLAAVVLTTAETPAICACAPVLTSGTVNTGVTVRLPVSDSNAEAGIVAVQLPAALGLTDTGIVVPVPSVAETDTAVASGCATPETASDPPVWILAGAPVMALRAYGATELQPAIGPTD
jgi:hypothetical protein